MKRMTLVALFVATTLGLSAQKPMNAPKGGKAISDELIGIFFEDISSSADGGLMPSWYRTVRSSTVQVIVMVGELVPHGNKFVQVTHWEPWRFARTMVSIPTTPPTCDCMLNA